MDDGLVEMLEYNRWATRGLLLACRQVSEPALDERLPGFSGSCRELVLHLVGGQQTFVLRTRGRQHEGELNRDSPWPGWDPLVEIADQTSEALLAAARSPAQADEIELPYGRRRYRYPIRFFLVHAVEHGVEHRTEIKLQLGQQGIPTPDLDGWQFAAARGYGAESRPGGSGDA
jgi:uncharacterized damage-inducible protein DinB